MSYRNPKQFVDTQTAQHYRNLQNTMMGITEDYVRKQKLKIAEEAKRAAEIQEKNEKIAKLQTQYENSVGKAWNNATGERADIFAKAGSKIKEAINTAGKFSTEAFLTSDQKNYKTNLESLNSFVKRDLINLDSYKEGYKTKKEKRGELGGYSLENDPDQFAFVSSVLGGGLKGETSFDFDLSQYGGPITKYSYKNPDTGETYTLTGSIISEISNNPDRDILVTIPDETANMQNIANEFGKTIIDGKATDEIKDIYYANQQEKSRVKKDGTIQYYVEPNENLFVQNIKSAVVSKIDGLGEGISPNKIALFNFFKNKTGEKDSILPLNKEFTSEEEQEFNDELAAGYAAYVSKNFFREGKEIVTREVKPTEEEKEVDVSYIKDIEIPVAKGPSEEDGAFINLDDLERSIAKFGFRVTKAEEVGGRKARTLTKSVEGADRSVTIYDDMQPEEVKNLMIFLETGKENTTEQVDPFSEFIVNE